MTRLGIGVPTFNRAEQLARTLAAIARYTTAPHEVLVADDGSTDGTLPFLRRERIPHVAGRNRGIAWNKNRLLYVLREIRRCDVIILIEDDVMPCAPGWERPWVEAALAHGHVNYAIAWLRDGVLSGAGTPADPFVSEGLSGQCSAFSRTALRAAGYLDTRFRGYGFEHAEHSYRLARAGFGGSVAPNRFYLIESALDIAPLPSTSTEISFRANTEAQNVVGMDTSIYRRPWRSEAEWRALTGEAWAAAHLSGGRLLNRARLLRAALRQWSQMRREG
jgi:glycosyltransferase involved in cell wall biosynthesis